jgi:hypothetical protein
MNNPRDYVNGIPRKNKRKPDDLAKGFFRLGKQAAQLEAERAKFDAERLAEAAQMGTLLQALMASQQGGGLPPQGMPPPPAAELPPMGIGPMGATGGAPAPPSGMPDAAIGGLAPAPSANSGLPPMPLMPPPGPGM